MLNVSLTIKGQSSFLLQVMIKDHILQPLKYIDCTTMDIKLSM